MMEDRPVTVLFMNPAAQLGGAERSLLDVLASIRQSRPEWRLGLVVVAGGPLEAAASQLGVETFVLPLPPILAQLGDGGNGSSESQRRLSSLLRVGPAVAAYMFRLRRLIVRFSPDVLHSNGFKMHVLAALARPKRVPLVWHMHDFVRRRPLMSRLIRRLARRCTIVVANSVSVAEDVMSVCGERVPVTVMYNGIDLETFSARGEALDLDRLSGLPPADDDVVRVGLVATLGWWKGHNIFLEAIALLPQDLPIRGYVIGGALYETRGSQHTIEALELRAKALGIAGKVGFTGFVENPAAAMRALDVVVHASTEPEAFGLVIVEGMACERAVIASSAGGAAELVSDGVNGLGHQPGNPRDLARCIELLARNEALRRKLGIAGRATAEMGFGRTRLAVELLPIYAHAMAAGSR